MKFKGHDILESEERLDAYGQDILAYQGILAKEIDNLKTYRDGTGPYKQRADSIMSTGAGNMKSPERRNTENSGEIAFLTSARRGKTNTVTFGDDSRNHMGLHS